MTNGTGIRKGMAYMRATKKECRWWGRGPVRAKNRKLCAISFKPRRFSSFLFVLNFLNSFPPLSQTEEIYILPFPFHPLKPVLHQLNLPFRPFYNSGGIQSGNFSAK